MLSAAARAVLDRADNRQDQPASNWRNRLRIHPAADLCPPLSREEVSALQDDIAEHGLKVRVLLMPCDRALVLLDGRRRLDALEALGHTIFHEDGGLAVPHEIIDGPEDGDPYKLVASLNLHRRHLNRAQRAGVAEALLKAEPQRSDRSIASIAKLTHPAVARVRRRLENTGDVERFSTRKDVKGRRQPATRKSRPAVSCQTALAAETVLKQTFPVEADKASVVGADRRPMPSLCTEAPTSEAAVDKIAVRHKDFLIAALRTIDEMHRPALLARLRAQIDAFEANSVGTESSQSGTEPEQAQEGLREDGAPTPATEAIEGTPEELAPTDSMAFPVEQPDQAAPARDGDLNTASSPDELMAEYKILLDDDRAAVWNWIMRGQLLGELPPTGLDRAPLPFCFLWNSADAEKRKCFRAAVMWDSNPHGR